MEPQAISSDLIRGHIDTIILHALLNGDKFAQQISDAIEQKSDSEYKINQATLYSSLKRLESLKYVSSYWYDSDVGGRRKYFKLTDLGKKTVEDNILNWSYSRGIIDKLMDCSPQPIFRTQYVEKIVPVEREITPIQTKSVEKIEEKSTEVVENKPENQQKPVESDNFRLVLNGLVKPSKHEETDLEQLQPIEKSEPVAEKLKFNETISASEYNPQITHSGKIDFSDIVINAEKDGYKVRVSSKNSHESNKSLLINKLNLYSALAMYLLVMVEFLVVSLVYKNLIDISPLITIASVVLLTVFPVVMAGIYIKSPKKKTSKSPTFDAILTVSIIIFNLLLVIIACSLIFELNFANPSTVLFAIIVPISLLIHTLLYFIIRLLFSKNKKFIIRKEKTA